MLENAAAAAGVAVDVVVADVGVAAVGVAAVSGLKNEVLEKLSERGHG